MVLGQYLQRSAQISPEKIALVYGQQRMSYRELARASNSFSHFLCSEGLQTGDRVAIFLDNSPETVIAIFGVLSAGGCLVVVNPMTPPDRFGFMLENSSAKFVVASSMKFPVVQQAVTQCAVPPKNILTGDDIPPGEGWSFAEVSSRSESPVPKEVNENDLAAIIYTSGSTGKPKGVTLTHKNIDTVTASVTTYLCQTADDIILQFLPLSIGYGMLQLLVTFKNSGRLVLEKGFGYPYEIVKKLKEEKVTGFAGVPTVFSILTGFTQLEKEDFSSLRYITNAAAALPPSFVPKLKRIFPTAKIFLMHGLTECLRTTYLPPEDIDRKPTSVGKGMPNVELWIEDPQGKRLSAGETGELVVYGENIMRGYWNDPENTAKVLRDSPNAKGKALYTGDLFTMDDEGCFYFVARADEVIKSKGLKISPLEVEDVIYMLDEVQEVRVLGIPDERLGQAVKAEIVLKKDAILTEEVVKAKCRNHLEEYKIPHIIEFVKLLPKSPGGKIKRLG